MSLIESWFPTAAYAVDRYHSWRMAPWWPSESRGCRQRSLLRLLALAHDERLDVVPLLNNYADEQFGIYRARVRRLARRVADGTPIVQAIEQTPEVLGDEAVLAIRFVVRQTGTLSEAYQDLIATRDAAADLPQLRIQHATIYALVSVVVIGLVAVFLAMLIYPQLIAIYQDFGMDQTGDGPFAFTLLLNIYRHIGNNAPLYVLLIVAIACLCLAAPTRRWVRRFLVPRWAGDAVQARTSEILRLLALSLEAGRPVGSALSTLAHFHFDNQVRQRLLIARNQIEQGADEWTSLADVRLLTAAESRALATSSTDQSRIWSMRRLATWKRRHVLNQRDRAASLLLPAVTLVLSAFVLLICCAMFSFLAYIIWFLA